MRAKLLLGAALLLTAIQPVFADDLLRDVHETLYRPVDHRSLLTGFIDVGAGVPACGVITQSAVIGSSCAVETQPAVLAPAGACVTAILTRDPSDLDIRREELAQKIACLGGALNACDLSMINGAMQEINNAELAMRADGYLDNYESRRLYKAMDRLGSHVDHWSGAGRLTIGSLIGYTPGVWY